MLYKLGAISVAVGAVFVSAHAGPGPHDHGPHDGHDHGSDPLGGLGGMGGGMPGMDALGGLGGLGDLFKTEKNCDVKKCPKGQFPLQKSWGVDSDAKVFSYGCGDDSLSFMNPGKQAGEESATEECCVMRTICMQTCGRTKGQCEYEFDKCKKQKCKGDQQCIMGVDMGIAMAEMTGGIGGSHGTSGKPKCAEYENWQQTRCDCVEESDYENEFKNRIQEFYLEAQEDKLNDGKADDDFMDSVIYKSFPKARDNLAKFSPKIFGKLFQKYADKMVEKKEREKPDFMKNLGKDMPGMGEGGELEAEAGEEKEDEAGEEKEAEAGEEKEEEAEEEKKEDEPEAEAKEEAEPAKKEEL